MFSGDCSAKKEQTNFENNNLAWVKVYAIKTMHSKYAVLNIVDTELAEIHVMWLIVNDKSEPLEQYTEFSSHTRVTIM